MSTTGSRKQVAPFAITILCCAAIIAAQNAPKGTEPEHKKPEVSMKITLTSVMVSDQDKALLFYTDVLGFVKKTDVPAGQGRWLTVVSPEDPDGPELLLEPIGFPPSKTFQKALFDAGIPWTSFQVADVRETFATLKELGVVFLTEPTEMDPVTIAMFEDTCGNLIQIMSE